MTAFMAGGLGAIVCFGKNERNGIPGIADGRQQNTGTPMLLVENKGQIVDQHGKVRNDIDFRTGNDRVQVFMGEGLVHYQWAVPAGGASSKGQPGRIRSYRMDVELLGCNKQARVVRGAAGNYEERYYAGKTPVTAGAYERITYKEVLPHIDWTFYCNRDGKLEYDFIIHPGGKVSDIRLRYNGTSSLTIDGKGNLVAGTPQGSVTEAAPRSYAQDGETVASAFVLEHNVLGFKTAPHRGTLVIDPTVEWATYYGGDSSPDNAWTTIDKIAVDQLGNTYIAGRTSSTNNIATTGAYQTVLDGNLNIYIARINTAGQQVWGTYYGSDNATYLGGMACDKDNNVYLVGTSKDALPGFASPGAHQEAIRGGSGDAFLIKLSSGGTRLWATFYGGSYGTQGTKVACDPWGNVYLSGITYSPDNTIYPNAIATPGTHKTVYDDSPNPNDQGDAFLAKFDSQGHRLWGTYFGGSKKENFTPNDGDCSYGGLACDKAGNVYLAGTTSSTDQIAYGNSHQAIFGGTGPNIFLGDGFLAKFDSSGQVIWGTYYGGSKSDQVADLTIDANNNLYLLGKTGSVNAIASAGAFKANYGAVPSDASLIFIARFDTAGVRQWGTYYGEYAASSAWHILQAQAITTDILGKLWISGVTDSDSGIVTSNGLHTDFTGTSSPYLVQFNPQNGYPVWGSYYGDGPAWGTGNVRCDPFGGIHFSCASIANGWATPNSHQSTYLTSASEMGLLVKFEDCDSTLGSIVLPAIAGDTLICPGAQVTYSVADVAGSYNWSLPPGWTGSSDSAKIIVTAGTVAGNVSVSANFTCGSSNQRILHIGLYPLPAPVISRTGNTLTTGSFSSYQWYLNGTAINAATGASFSPTQSGSYTVKVTSDKGCEATSPAFSYENVGIDGRSAAGDISLYPNPAQDKIHIRTPYPVNVSIDDLSGRQLKWQRRAETVMLGDLPAGLYLVKVWSTGGRLLYVEKLVKNR